MNIRPASRYLSERVNIPRVHSPRVTADTSISVIPNIVSSVSPNVVTNIVPNVAHNSVHNVITSVAPNVVQEVHTKSIHDPVVTNVYRTTTARHTSPVRFVEPRTTMKSSITAINPGKSRVSYIGELEPVVTSVRQVNHPGAETVTKVNTKIINEQVIEHDKSLLENEIRKLRKSVINADEQDRNISMYKQKIAVLKGESLNDDLKSKRVAKQNEELYKRLKTSENQNQNLILLIKELENKIITLEKELTDTEGMVQRETNLRVELEAEIRGLKDQIRILEGLNTSQQTHNSEFGVHNQREIHQLKTRIGELERQNEFLKNRIESLESQSRDYQNQIEQLRNQLADRDRELEQFRSRCKNLESELQIALDENRLLKEQNHRLQLNLENDGDGRATLETKVSEFNSIISRMERQKHDADSEAQRLKDLNDNLSHDLRGRQNEIQALKQKFDQYQAQFNVDSQRLQDKNSGLNSQIKRMEGELQSAQSHAVSYKRGQEEAQGRINSLMQELDNIKHTNSKLQSENGDMRGKLSRLESELQKSIDERDHLRLRPQKQADNTNLQNKIRTLESRVRNQDQDNSSLKNQLAKQKSTYESKISKQNQEIDGLRSEIQRLKSENQGLAFKNQSMTSENSKLNKLLKQTQDKFDNAEAAHRDAIRQLKIEKETSNSQKAQIQDLKKQLEQEISINKTIELELRKSENELRETQNQISSLQNKISNYKDELKRLKYEIEQLNSQIADLRDKNNLLQIDNNELEQKVNF